MKKTRKGLAILLSVLLALTVFAPFGTVSFAEGEEPSVVASGYCGADENHTDAEWTLTSDGLLTIKGSGEVTNPTLIGSGPWYEYLEDIKEVVVGDGITKLPWSAFDYCVNLETISYPKTLSTYDDGQLFYCPSLKTIIMDPENPNFTVGADSCLYSKDMTELIKYPAGLERTSFSIPDGVTKLRFAAFYETHALQQIVVPDSVTVLEDEVFYGCSALTDVNIPPHVTSFGTCMFYNCSSLERFAIPDYFTEIPNYTFHGCTSLVSIEISENVTKIGSGAFWGCESMPTIELHDGITEIGQGAFGECRALESIILPCNITTIERQTFVNCDSLQWITIPAAVRSIGEQAFGEVEMFGCTSLEAVNYMGTDYAWNHSVYVAGKNSSLQNATVYCHRDGHHVFTEELVTEPTEESEGLKRLTCTLCPYSYTESISFTDHDWGDWTIAQNSTYDEPGLAQRVCRTNPSHTESFEISAYGPAVEVGCCGLGSDPVYYVVYEDGTLLITGTGAIRAHMFNTGNGPVSANVRNTNRLIIEDGVTAIGDSAFAFLHFDSIDFGDTLVSIGQGAFYDNDGFETVVLPKSVKTVGDCAFGLSSDLKTVVFGPNVETVGDWALLQCYELQNVVFLNKDTQIIEEAHGEHLGTVLHTVNSGTIYGYAGGAVETYARTYGFRFVPLDDENWIRLPYGMDGLADGDWYFDDETFVDIIGRDKTQAEKDAVLESLHQHVTFYYYPNGGLFLIRYDYDNLPIEGVPVSGSAVYPFDFIANPDTASLFDCEAMAESIAQYTAPTQPDNPQPDNPQPDQPQQEESSPRLIDRLLAPFKAFVSLVLSFFRKMFR